MRHFRILALAAGFNLTGFTASAIADHRELLTIEVVIVNESSVPKAVLAEAQQLAARIYALVDIHVVWRDSTAPSIVGATDAAPRFAVIVIPQSTFGHKAHTMGLAINGGTLAYIFQRSVEDFSQLRSIPYANTLGNALAHELGHLLLPNRPHAASGIMRRNWDRLHELTILKNSATGLAFTSEEMQVIRKNAGDNRD